MKTEHTNGEWSYTVYNRNIYIKSLFEGNEIPIAEVYRWQSQDEITQNLFNNKSLANAKLIVASPFLLQTLIKVQKDLEQFSLSPSTENLINSAIKLATE